MAYIKEPKGVDFIIESDPLTAEARQEISKFISNYNSTLKDTSVDIEKLRKRQKLVLA